ncbi:hypothetical protein [Paraburkholderia sp. J7]|uniref:hypothetical protein n=1 Tax=Paraburkholderia sp. J7 TaxID=2805438 RepID=UPI002AB7DF46|nr:hypothetical protein [Paraburkholderia sp. J7]
MGDFLGAMLIGLFGPTVAEYLSKYKYRYIFSGVVISFYVVVFISMSYKLGLRLACTTFVDRLWTPVGILVPVGLGCSAVVVAFIGSVSVANNKAKNGKQGDA